MREQERLPLFSQCWSKNGHGLPIRLRLTKVYVDAEEEIRGSYSDAYDDDGRIGVILGSEAGDRISLPMRPQPGGRAQR